MNIFKTFQVFARGSDNGDLNQPEERGQAHLQPQARGSSQVRLTY